MQELAHCPLLQAVPPEHANPTEPQLLESVFTFTHAVLGPSLVKTGAATWLAGQLVVHTPLEHAWPSGHGLSQAPQCLADVFRFTHRSPHRVASSGQLAVQVPPTQACLPGQTLPQPPQFSG